MFVLPMCVYLMHVRQWSRSRIHSGIRSNDCRLHETQRYESWPAAKAILLISAEGLERLLPMVTCLVPVYEPMVVALMIGCITLAEHNSQGLNSNKRDGIQAVEDVA
jgi:hypothetical protein